MQTGNGPGVSLPHALQVRPHFAAKRTFWQRSFEQNSWGLKSWHCVLPQTEHVSGHKTALLMRSHFPEARILAHFRARTMSAHGRCEVAPAALISARKSG